MIRPTSETQRDYYRGFLMGRGNFDPRDFGVNLNRDDLTDQMVDEFNTVYRGGWTIDELLLHPREASLFCDQVRRKFAYFDLPDDLILRVILTRRKNPA